ncbi:MAG: hypothetical protein Tsb002_38620 [Wenzhouxiangellaceae bacterium]
MMSCNPQMLETELDTARLPECTRLLIDLIGLELTMKLLNHYGGRHLYIPKRIHSRTALLRVVPQSQAVRLSRFFGGETLDIPKVDTIKRQFRDLAIAAATAAGASRAELVTHYGLSRRQIGNIRRKYRRHIDRLMHNGPMMKQSSQRRESASASPA